MLTAMNDDFPILAAVAAQPTHPYALLDHLAESGLPVTRSTLYRRVDTLLAQGWLSATDVRGENGHFRRALALTRRGREQLLGDCREVLATAALESPLFALAIAAFADAGPEALAAILKPRMAAAARTLTTEELALRNVTAGPGELARSRRIAHLQADIAWLQGLLGRRVVEPSSGREGPGARASA